MCAGVVEAAHVADLQRDLWRFGLDPGSFTRTYGAGTQGAVVCFQIETYYHVIDGRLDPEDAFGQSEQVWIDTWAIDGIAGTGTKAALRAWLENDLRAEYPRTVNVATDAKRYLGNDRYSPVKPVGVILMNRQNTDGGAFHYQGEGRDRPELDESEWWGQPPIVYALERTIRKWYESTEVRVQIGDMSKPEGGEFEPHGSHSFGMTADIRPIVTSEEYVGRYTDLASDHYDRAGSYRFLKLVIKESPKSNGKSLCRKILFNDRAFRTNEIIDGETQNFYIRKVGAARNHHHHFHIQNFIDPEH